MHVIFSEKFFKFFVWNDLYLIKKCYPFEQYQKKKNLKLLNIVQQKKWNFLHDLSVFIGCSMKCAINYVHVALDKLSNLIITANSNSFVIR